DGDFAPLTGLLHLAEAHDAWLYLDDAHGFGLLGPHGQGSLAHWAINSPRIVYMATLGKAAGVAGAFVAGQADLIQWLINKAHTYIYTTAQPPMLAATVSASLQLITNEGWRRERLQALIQQLRAGCESLPWRLLPSSTAIQPLQIGGSAAALALAQQLRERGIWVPAIRPPTVPEGTARLRISLSAEHTADDVNTLLAALKELA
ncbi:MAG: aminotransferase class I/II-fold pyridoxal phosphate-dependent enzyme, partial [Burkholderiales bacterium]